MKKTINTNRWDDQERRRKKTSLQNKTRKERRKYMKTQKWQLHASFLSVCLTSINQLYLYVKIFLILWKLVFVNAPSRSLKWNQRRTPPQLRPFMHHTHFSLSPLIRFWWKEEKKKQFTKILLIGSNEGMTIRGQKEVTLLPYQPRSGCYRASCDV